MSAIVKKHNFGWKNEQLKDAVNVDEGTSISSALVCF